MTRSIRWPAAVLLPLLLAACAGPALKDVTRMYETQPEGATLYEGGKVIGTAPVTRSYPYDGKSELVRTPDVTAVWPSGAREVYYTLLPPGADRVATIERPKSAPNLQADLEHAKKFIAAREADKQRIKDEQRREQARNSQRCRDQQSKGSGVVDDCS